jgi:hypothetical protein
MRVVVFHCWGQRGLRPDHRQVQGDTDSLPSSSPPPTPRSNLCSILWRAVVQADQYLCLDADMLVLDDLQPVYAALDVCPPGTILACREGNGYGFKAWNMS